MLDNLPLLWTGPGRVGMLFYSLNLHARRVAGHRTSSVMPPRRRILSVCAAVSVPFLCMCALYLSDHHRKSWADFAELLVFAPLSAFILGMPQVICLSLRESGRLSRVSLLVGVIAADLLVVFFTVVYITVPNDGDSIGWLMYFAACAPAVPAGILAGKLIGGITSRL
jgi:hypothetical protein